MAEYTFNPSSPACGQWEMLLTDALDGLLRPEDEAVFTAHMAHCPACAALFDEARRGREWLEFLCTEPEAPAGLLDKILAQTGPGQIAGYGLIPSESNVLPMPPRPISIPAPTPAWQYPGFMGQVRRYAEPRLLMTAAMAFFSIALTLNMTGARLTGLRLSELRPSAVRSILERRLMTASTPVVRYYDHLRIRYEVESRLRDLRRLTQEEDQYQDRDNRQRQKDAAPGETRHENRQSPGGKDAGPRMDTPQRSAEPAPNNSEFLETSLTFQQRPAHSGGSAIEIRERSTVWTA
jgi:hypothetical protein